LKKQYTREQRLRLIKEALILRKEGLPWTAIAEKIGVDRVTLQRWLKALQQQPIPLDPAEVDDAYLQRIRDAYLNALGRIEDILKDTQPDREAVATIKMAIDALTVVMKGLHEIEDLIAVRRSRKAIRKGSDELRKAREELAKSFGAKAG